MTYTSTATRAAIGAALLAGAIALWLAIGSTSFADTAPKTQDTTVTVGNQTISWGTAAGCVQDMGVASFGTVSAGAVADSAFFKGCVTSNSPGWDVVAVGTDLVGLDAANVISLYNENINVGTLSGSASAAGSPCDSYCNLWFGAAGIVTDAATGTGGFDYQYRLNVPAGQVADTYRNTVTFTASN
jgi:hypothetical protein